MNKKRFFGFFFVFVGIIVFFAKPITSITGFVIADNFAIAKAFWFYFAGILCIITGMMLLHAEQDAYQQRESKLKAILGERYSSLSEGERPVLNKSYRRHVDKREKELREAEKPEDISQYRIIRTEAFERAIKGHNEEEINSAVRKIGTGLGKQEKLVHLDGQSIRTSKRGRVLFNINHPRRTIWLTGYTSAHRYQHRRS